MVRRHVKRNGQPRGNQGESVIGTFKGPRAFFFCCGRASHAVHHSRRNYRNPFAGKLPRRSHDSTRFWRVDETRSGVNNSTCIHTYIHTYKILIARMASSSLAGGQRASAQHPFRIPRACMLFPKQDGDVARLQFMHGPRAYGIRAEVILVLDPSWRHIWWWKINIPFFFLQLGMYYNTPTLCMYILTYIHTYIHASI